MVLLFNYSKKLFEPRVLKVKMHPDAAKAINNSSTKNMREFRRISNHALAAMHPISKFNAIRTIVMDINRRFPDLDGNEIPLDTSFIENEVEILMRISSTIRPSEIYLETVNNITWKAIQQLIEREDPNHRISSWSSLSNEARNVVFEHLHKAIIDCAKEEFDHQSVFSQHLRPVKITPFFEAAVKYCEKGNPLGLSYGYADVDLNFPGCHELYYNQHPDSQFDDVFEVIDTGCHETAHAIEGQLVYLFNSEPHKTPLKFRQDAINFHALRKANGYIPSRILTPYQFQCNEFVAFSAGQTAQNALAFCM
jgi:hypothetical protein